MTRTMTFGAILAALPALGMAQDAPYAGQDSRAIASLSQSDVDAILAGQGWGLAKPAELNGYPGPLHVLELADEIALTDDQRAAVQAIYDQMKKDAMAAGKAYVDAEAHLSMMFRMGHANGMQLQTLLDESAAALAALRAVHLNAHLVVTPMLTEAQRAAYQDLRGYGAGDGHDGHSHQDSHSGDHAGHSNH